MKLDLGGEWVFMGFSRENITAFTSFKLGGMDILAIEDIALGSPVYVNPERSVAVRHDPKTVLTPELAQPEKPKKTYIDELW